MTSSEPRRTARLIIDAARAGYFNHRDAVASLNGLKAGEDAVVPYLVEQLQSDDYWTRHDAIDSLGALGRKASPAINTLQRLLNDTSPLIRLKAAKALFLISDKVTELRKELKVQCGSDDPVVRNGAMKTLAELGPSGAEFVPYAVAEIRRSPPNLAEEAIHALQAVGTKEAVAALRAAAESSDWMLRSQATGALQQLRSLRGAPER